MNDTPNPDPLTDGEHASAESESVASQGKTVAPATEFGGRREGLDPTRYGDWEKGGRCIDF